MGISNGAIYSSLIKPLKKEFFWWFLRIYFERNLKNLNERLADVNKQIKILRRR